MAVKKVEARPKIKPIIPYSASDSILLVGEGVFQLIARSDWNSQNSQATSPSLTH
jgi:hypothetical protein